MALHHTAKNNHLEAVRMLLDHHADADAKESDGSAPLLYACQNGHFVIIRELMERGADAYVTDSLETA
jgi:ankyrin repeat protein